MKAIKPWFFDRVADEALDYWKKLESDERLMALSRQLFSQVKNPHHVISELLQNADDAGATRVRINKENDIFVFQHNGADFDESAFHSICQFGFSNKIKLHTIGFRGMGFKSTFSLGSRVEVITPTFAFAFTEKRFTYPDWIETEVTEGCTTIRVQLDHVDNIDELIDEWIKNPVPMLFFRNLKDLQILETIIKKEPVKAGPVPNSMWIELKGERQIKVLHITSQLEEFPADAIKEVQEERHESNFSLPPCRVDIVLGVPDDQYLYVVLPTSEKLNLPFSVNAPFIPFPDRKDIKPFLTSPTNRWLIERVGKLAVSTLLSWVCDTNLSIEERLLAYQLLPEIGTKGVRDKNKWSQAVKVLLKESLDDKSFLVNTFGECVSPGTCFDVNRKIYKVWSAEKIIELFDQGGNTLLAEQTNEEVCNNLSNWGWLRRISGTDIFVRLCKQPYPQRPENQNLAYLWEFVDEHYWSDWYNTHNYWSFSYDKDNLAIIPVENSTTLYPRNEVVFVDKEFAKLGEHQRIFFWKFIKRVDNDFIKFISGKGEDNQKVGTPKNLQSWINNLNLDQGLSIDSLVGIVSDNLFTNNEDTSIRIEFTHILCELILNVPDSFLFRSKSGSWLSPKTHQYLLSNEKISKVLPSKWIKSHTIDDLYQQGLDKQQKKLWKKWLRSKQSKLRKFPLPTRIVEEINWMGDFEMLLESRNAKLMKDLPYPNVAKFIFTDFDFESSLWEYWDKIGASKPEIWFHILMLILQDWDHQRKLGCEGKIEQKPRTASHLLAIDSLPANWLRKFRQKRCLKNQKGELSYPEELYRRTAETKPLETLEDFVHPDLDKPHNQEFLDALHVKKTPVKIEDLFSRLKLWALSDLSSSESPLSVYQAIDGMVARMKPAERKRVQEVFEVERIIFSEGGTWQNLSKVCIRNDRHIPGCYSVSKELQDLHLWKVLNVPDAPTTDQILRWLSELHERVPLLAEDNKKVREIIKWDPVLVWERGRHWNSLAGIWTNIESFAYKSREHELRKNLFPWELEKIADFSLLDEQFFYLGEHLVDLDKAIEFRISEIQLLPEVQTPTWLKSLILNLECYEIGSKETEEISNPADNPLSYSYQRFHYLKWQPVYSLTVIPFYKENQIGGEQKQKVFLQGSTLYMDVNSGNYHFELARVISQGIFENRIVKAISDCIDRDPDWINSYFSEYLGVKDSFRDLLKIKLWKEEKVNSSYEPVNLGTELPVKDKVQEQQVNHHVEPSEIFTRRYATERNKSILNVTDTQPRVGSLHGTPSPEVEDAAMKAVMEREKENNPKDVSKSKKGWDIETDPGTDTPKFLEVKGRERGQNTITVSRNEIREGLKKGEDYILAVVEVSFMGNFEETRVHYIPKPFRKELDDAVTFVVFDWKELLKRREISNGSS